MRRAEDAASRLRAPGRAARALAVVSGAGPTVLAFTSDGEPARALTARCPEGWLAHPLAVDHDGVRVD